MVGYQVSTVVSAYQVLGKYTHICKSGKYASCCKLARYPTYTCTCSCKSSKYAHGCKSGQHYYTGALTYVPLKAFKHPTIPCYEYLLLLLAVLVASPTPKCSDQVATWKYFLSSDHVILDPILAQTNELHRLPLYNIQIYLWTGSMLWWVHSFSLNGLCLSKIVPAMISMTVHFLCAKFHVIYLVDKHYLPQ